jgi:flagellar hook-associated protein 3 FlgL
MAATSFSRLGTANSYDNVLRNLQSRQTALSSLQENLTSGKRVVVASDDPTGAAQAERSLTRIARIASDQRALEAQRNSITAAEGALGDVTDALQGFRELVVSAGNAAFTPAERRSVALQLTGLRDQIFALSNRTDSNGLPLFSSLGSALAPFVGPTAPPQDYTFNGLPGQAASTEVAIPFTLDGDSAFMHQPARDGVYNVTVGNITPPATVASPIPTSRTLQTNNVTVTDPTLVNGSSYSIAFTAVDTTTVPGTTTVTYDVTETPNVGGPFVGLTASYPTILTGDKAGTGSIPITVMPGLAMTISGTPAVGDTIAVDSSPSIFSVLDDAIRDIGGAGNNNAASQAVSQALFNLDIGMERVSAVRGRAGDLLNRADRITTNQEKRSIQLEADRSRAEDLDMIKGISDFQNQQTGYQAALQSYAQVQKLSLFNYIG